MTTQRNAPLTETLEGHLVSNIRDYFEAKHGLTYCRRCGYVAINDSYPDKPRKRCPGPVKVEFR